MKVKNRSGIDTNEIKALTSFVEDCTTHSYMATLEVEPSEDGMSSSGVAYRFNPEHELPQSPPGLVKVSVSGATYPYLSVHRKASGGVVLQDWREEFVLVLAHELRHVAQFWGGVNAKQKEVDAERFAIAVLNEWRSIQRRSKCN